MRSAAESIVPRPEDTKSQFFGGPHGEIDELSTASWRYRDEDLWAMDQGAGECRAPLCGWEQPPGKLIFEVRNAAEVEHFKGSGARGAGICAADAKERHGHVLRHGERWQEAWVMKKKAEDLIAKLSKLFFRKMRNALAVQKNLSGIGRLEQTENAKQKSLAGTIRAIKLTEGSRIERGCHVFDQGLSCFIPIHAMAAESFAGKNGIHF